MIDSHCHLQYLKDNKRKIPGMLYILISFIPFQERLGQQLRTCGKIQLLAVLN